MKIGIIGFGDMGRSLVTGFIKRGISQENILVCDITERNIKKARNLGVADTDFDTLTEKSDTVLFAVPKTAFDKMDIKPEKFADKTVISCMAEVTMAQLKKKIPGTGGARYTYTGCGKRRFHSGYMF